MWSLSAGYVVQFSVQTNSGLSETPRGSLPFQHARFPFNHNYGKEGYWMLVVKSPSKLIKHVCNLAWCRHGCHWSCHTNISFLFHPHDALFSCFPCCFLRNWRQQAFWALRESWSTPTPCWSCGMLHTVKGAKTYQNVEGKIMVWHSRRKFK